MMHYHPLRTVLRSLSKGPQPLSPILEGVEIATRRGIVESVKGKYQLTKAGANLLPSAMIPLNQKGAMAE